MMLLSIFMIFMLIWSALVWGLATSGDEKNHSWPNFWRLNILVSIVPLAGILMTGLLPETFKIWLQSTVLRFLNSPERVVETAQDGVFFVSEAPKEAAFAIEWPALVLAIYVVGFVIGLALLIKGKMQAQKVVKNSVYLAEHDLWLTEADVPPFASSHKGGRVIFPSRLYETLSKDQITLIATHERAHIAHKDPLWIDILYLVRVVFWFNPFIRDLISKWHIAIELRTDSVTLENASAPTRKAYAQSFLAALQIPTGGIATTSAAFSNKKIRSEKMRLKNIMSGEGASSQRRAPLYMTAFFGGLALIGCASAAGVTVAADDPEEKQVWVEKKGDAEEMYVAVLLDEEQGKTHRGVIIQKGKDGSEREWSDLTDEEREEILEELEEAEEEIAEAMEEMKEAEIEIAEAMAEAEIEMKEAMIEMRLAEKEMVEAEKEMQRVIKIEMIDAEKEMVRAEKELEKAQAELAKQRKELEREHKRLQKEKK